MKVVTNLSNKRYGKIQKDTEKRPKNQNKNNNNNNAQGKNLRKYDYFF